MKPTNGEFALEMQNITKRFPGVIANDSIDLEVKHGEILALLGENGAGKSTLMKILSGVHTQDEGVILINGEKVSIDSPNAAEEHGIAMVYQHFMLVERLTVLENIALGLDPTTSTKNESSSSFLKRFSIRDLISSIRVDYNKLRNELDELAEKYGIDIDLDDHIWELDVGERQKVEILKALYKDSQILVLDEPTAVLTPQESENLFEIIKEIRKDGLAVIFITHRLEEIIKHADRTTVIRDGSVVGSADPSTVTESDLAEMMVGKEVLLDIDREEVEKKTNEPVLMTVDLSAKDERGNKALKNVNIKVNKGEIVGIAGVSGNGQSQLAECLAGIRESDGGKIYFESNPIEHESRSEYIKNHIFLIPEDRHKFGSVPGKRVVDNAILGHHSNFSTGITLDWDAIKDTSNQLIEDFDVRVPDIYARAGDLSGGNLQKLICGRELSNDPNLLIANQPTRGVDVGAIEKIRQLILKKRKDDVGIILISEDLDELFQMSDRILVMYDGEIVYRNKTDDCDAKTLGQFMGGKKSPDEENIEKEKMEPMP